MNKRQVFLNAVTTFCQELVSAAVLFLLYRFLISTIGIEGFGIWSLVLATTSVVTLANQGFTTSITKFVAKYAAQEKADQVSSLIQTAMIATGFGLAIVSVSLYPLGRWILKLILPSGAVSHALALLPFALISLWLNVVGGILMAGLSGYELITIRNYIVLGGTILFLLLCYIFVPAHGLLGLAHAQVVQSTACFAAAWILLRKRLTDFPVVPRRWSRTLFGEMFEYGLQFQFIAISQALREPTTKMLLGIFGGLAMTGYYDVASRWVVSFRELIVQANQALVPTVSSFQQQHPKLLPALYRDAYRLIFFLSIPTFASVIAAAPIVSRVWLGSLEPAFVTFVALLGAGWLVNVLTNPAYVFDLGMGTLRWVSIACALTGVLNISLGFVIGRRLGGTGVVAVSAASLAIGYVIVLVSYHLQNQISFSMLLPTESFWIILSGATGVLIFLPAFYSISLTNSGVFKISAFAVAGLLSLLGFPMWFHPLRRRLMNWALSMLPA